MNKHKTIYIQHFLIILSLLVIAVSSCTEQAREAKTNMLIIQPDQHRADVLGCAGDPLALTPNLDRLASSGVRFTNAASASPVCCPFRATLQTGLYIHEHGVVENGIQLKYDFQTIGEIFSENGYATGYAGKWHLDGFLPKERVGGYIEPGDARQGWQEWLGYEKSHEFFEVWKYNDQGVKERVPGYNWEPTWHTDMALNFIDRNTRKNQPWCYYIAYGPPHKPEQCPPEFLEKIDPAKFKLPPGAQDYLSQEQKEELRKILQIYYAQVAAVDHEVGRLMQGLKDVGAAENTIIVYVSDHGDVLGSHNEEIVHKYIETNRNVNNTLRTKGKPFSTAFRIPLIISGHKSGKKGVVSDALVSSIDLAPTILDLAGIEIPTYMQGQSMASWYSNGSGPEQPHLYLGLHDNHNAWRAIWNGRYLLSELDYQLLYDYIADPMESNNLYNDAEFADLKYEFRAQLIELANKTKDPILPRLQQITDN